MSDNNSQNEVEFNWNLIDHLFQLGVALVFFTVVFAFSRERIKDLWPPSNSPIYYSKLLGVVLLVVIVLLVLRWILSVMGEIRMLKWYMKDSIKSQPIKAYLWTILFSIFLGTMACFSSNITVCSAAFAIYSCFDVWGQKIRNTQLAKGLVSMDADERKDKEKELNVIKCYYLEKPQIERSVTLMFFSFVGLLFAQASLFQSEATIKAWLECAAFVVVIANITVGELIIFRWRRARDKDLDKVWSF